ncbi:MAG: hypothetical protein ORN98_09670 [Alphaproteobacteria bacterium]|nr:hypothetical protein [Alphaproteobacteria bacterium]
MTKIDIFSPNKQFMRNGQGQSSAERAILRQPDLSHLYANITEAEDAQQSEKDCESLPDIETEHEKDRFLNHTEKFYDGYAVFSCFAKMAVGLGWLQPNGLAQGETLTGLVEALAQQSEESLINSSINSKDENLQFLALEILLSWGRERESLFANLHHHAQLRDLISEAVKGFLSLARHENDVADLFALFGAHVDSPDWDKADQARPSTVPQFIALRMIDALCGWEDFARAFQHAIKVIPMPIYRIVVELSHQDRLMCRRHIADVVAALHKAL